MGKEIAKGLTSGIFFLKLLPLCEMLREKSSSSEGARQEVCPYDRRLGFHFYCAKRHSASSQQTHKILRWKVHHSRAHGYHSTRSHINIWKKSHQLQREHRFPLGFFFSFLFSIWCFLNFQSLAWKASTAQGAAGSSRPAPWAPLLQAAVAGTEESKRGRALCAS